MKRLRIRVNILRALRLSIGAIMFSAIWAMAGRKDEWNGYILFFGMIGFFVLVGWMVHETNMANESVNIRVDHELIRNDLQDRRIAALERRLGLDILGDTPPHGIPVIRPEDDVR